MCFPEICFPAGVMRLTKDTLPTVTLPADRTEIIVFDEDLPGFGLRVRAGGKRTWIAQYRIGSQQRRLSLGSVEMINPVEARKAAKIALGKVTSGLDPQTEKSAARVQASQTLKALVPLYLAHAASRQRPSYHKDVSRYLETHWAPLGAMPVDKIGRADVAVRLNSLAKAGGPFAANRARAALSAFYSWAIGEGLAHANPTAGTNKPADEVSRDRVLSDTELALVWRHTDRGDFGAIVRLLILTGCRREEVGAMSWPEIDGDIWRIAGGRTKNGLHHELHLTSQARAILEAHPRPAERDLVFGSRAGPFSGWSKSKAELDVKMERTTKLPPWRIHDLRRTVATRMIDLGVLPHVVEAVLNHISGHRAGVAGVYNRSAYGPEKRAALMLWGEHVKKLVGAPDG